MGHAKPSCQGHRVLPLHESFVPLPCFGVLVVVRPPYPHRRDAADACNHFTGREAMGLLKGHRPLCSTVDARRQEQHPSPADTPRPTACNTAHSATRLPKLVGMASLCHMDVTCEVCVWCAYAKAHVSRAYPRPGPATWAPCAALQPRAKQLPIT